MDIYFGPYQGTKVKIENLSAPDPSCCSDAGLLCPRCAAKALAKKGFTANQLTANEGQEDILPLPTSFDEKEDDYVLKCPDFDCEDCLPLPPSLESILANERRLELARNRCDDDCYDEGDDDLLIPPPSVF